MDKAAYRSLVIFICLCAAGCACASLAVWVASGFVGSDIDYTESQTLAARDWGALIALAGFSGVVASVSAMFLSGRIARFILRLFGEDGAA